MLDDKWNCGLISGSDKRFFSTSECPNWCGASPNPYSVGSRGPFPRNKLVGVWNSAHNFFMILFGRLKT